MSATARLYTGEISLTQSELDSKYRVRMRGVPISSRDNWIDPDNGPKLKSSDRPKGTWQHALLSRDEGNPEPLRAYRADRRPTP